MTPTLIIGSGFLGRQLLTHPSLAPIAIQRSAAGAAATGQLRADMETLVGDVLAAPLAQGMAQRLRQFRGHAVCLLPPSALGQRDPATAFAPLFEALDGGRIQRAVLVSSTAVYGKGNGDTVTAGSTTASDSPRAARLVAIEQCWRDAFDALSIVRLAGIYGPGRVIGQRTIADAGALPGNGEEWLNLIHVADAARAITRILEHVAPRATYLIADGQPLRRSAYYGMLAGELGAAAPRFESDSPRPGGSRRCDPRDDWHSLGLEPDHPDSLAAVRDLLRAAPA